MPDNPDRPPTDAQAADPQPADAAPPSPTAPAPPAPPSGPGGTPGWGAPPAPPAPPGPPAPAAPPATDAQPGPGGPPGWGAPPAGPPWGPAGAGAPIPGAARPSPLAGAVTTLVGSAVTLGLGAVVAIGLMVTGDMPSEYFSGDNFLTMVAMLAAAAAPVALLLSWDEIDLSGFGAVALGGYLYVEVGDGTVLVGLIAAALAGLVTGAIVGVVRWLTSAHSALVTLGAGAILSGLATRVGPGPQGMAVRDARIDDLGLPLLTMFVVVGIAVLLSILFGQADQGPPSVPSPAGPGMPVGSYAPAPAAPTPGRAGVRVIPAFALSGMAGMLFGALQAGTIGYFAIGYFPLIPILVFAAVAVGGVVRGSGPFAPLTAAIASGLVVIIQDATLFHQWRRGEQEIVLGVLFVVCVAVAYGLRRVMTSTSRPGPAPGAPF